MAVNPAIPRSEVHQRLRFRRFVLASVFSLLYLVVLAAFHAEGRVDRTTLLQATAIVASAIVVFFLLFRVGLNLRFPDPSLTGLQFLAAVATMMYVVYRAPDTRLAFAAFFFVALMFGMLRSSGTSLTLLGGISLACFALVTWLRFTVAGDIAAWELDRLQLMIMAITFPWFVFIARRVTRLHVADRRKDEFLASLAHELRNPLAPIRTGVEILRMTTSDSPADRVLPMMERQLRHMTRLLDDLLDVSRISRGKITLRRERTDLRQVIDSALEAIRPLVDERGHTLVVNTPSTPVMLEADPVRLAQVVSNLVNNAAKYTNAGGRITLDARESDGEVEIEVTDNGIGLADESLESIFEMFTQVGSEAHAQGGLGIGLALAKGLVELHGGSIEAFSDGPGRGSTFRVRLPRRAPRRAEAPAQRARGVAASRLRILIVDDNRDAASSLSMLLDLLGHDVKAAYDGDTAVSIADEFRPQLVLLDLGMPDVSGYDACRRIRAQSWGGAMTIVAVTGWGQEEDRRKSQAAGFDGHLVKPLSPETLESLPQLVRASLAAA